jgi:DNA-directed RNA polymerase specialized sigma24 family protein
MSSSADQPISVWIERLKAGDRTAAQEIWNAYMDRLVRRARKHLSGARRRVADEEDVALSTFDAFCRNAERGRFPQVTNRSDLWNVLAVIAKHKAIDLRRHEGRPKRGGGHVRGESVFDNVADAKELGRGLEQIADSEPTPELAILMADESSSLLDSLDPKLRKVAVWSMKGWSKERIAARLDVCVRTVERRLLMIRGLWEAREVA